MILSNTQCITRFSQQNAWIYFAVIRRRVANDNGLRFGTDSWLRRGIRSAKQRRAEEP